MLVLCVSHEKVCTPLIFQVVVVFGDNASRETEGKKHRMNIDMKEIAYGINFTHYTAYICTKTKRKSDRNLKKMLPTKGLKKRPKIISSRTKHITAHTTKHHLIGVTAAIPLLCLSLMRK